jgi:hypothetical protein
MNSKDYNAKYYQANKNRILKMMSEKVMCNECGKKISRCNLPKHNRSPKHIKNADRKKNDEITTLQKRITELENKVFSHPELNAR